MTIDDFRDIFVPENASWTYFIPKAPSSPEGRYSIEPHVSGEVTNEIIQNHLDGKEGIVLSPFCSESEVKWAALDIDDGSLETVNKIYDELRKRNITPDIFRSKSKGYHVYIILDDIIKAEFIRIFLRDVLRNAKVSCEIFPKQNTITERGGSKIHLPFFGEIRKYVDIDGEDLGYLKTKNTAKEIVVSEDVLKKEKETEKKIPGGEWFPCCATVYEDGVNKGQRDEWAIELATIMRHTGTPDAKLSIDLISWNKKNKPPLTDIQLNKCLEQSKKYDGRNYPKCEEPAIKTFCKEDCPRLKDKGEKFSVQVSKFPNIWKFSDKAGYFLLEDGKYKQRTNYIINILKTVSDVKGALGIKDISMIIHAEGIEIKITVPFSITWKEFRAECALQNVALTTIPFIGKSDSKSFEHLLVHEVAKIPKQLREYVDLEEMRLDGILNEIMTYVTQYTIINLDELEEEEEVLRVSCKIGWKKKNKVYLKLAAFCDKARLPLEKTLSTLKKYPKIAKPSSARPPYDKSKTERVWIINIEGLEEEK